MIPFFELLDEMIEEVRTKHGLASCFVMSAFLYKQMVTELHLFYPHFKILAIDEYKGIPLSVSSRLEIDTVFLLPFDTTAINEEETK